VFELPLVSSGLRIKAPSIRWRQGSLRNQPHLPPARSNGRKPLPCAAAWLMVAGLGEQRPQRFLPPTSTQLPGIRIGGSAFRSATLELDALTGRSAR